MLASYKNIVVLTGAGVSRAAGLATYRGPGGLWSDPDKQALSTVEALEARRDDVTSMFWSFRTAIGAAQPTAAHRALAAFERRCAGAFTLVTQNVDSLHQRAGSHRVVEYHGTLQRWRCEVCGRVTEPTTSELPSCCGQALRPDVVLFGEMIPHHAEHEVKGALRDCDLFVAVGTSGTVWPAASFVRSAAYAGARTILLNLEVDDEARDVYGECYAGAADELVPHWFA
ncbi:MAG: Sir2 family NAD-dependent protein deacetylase [Deltaproteobacteria bacterium]